MATIKTAAMTASMNFIVDTSGLARAEHIANDMMNTLRGNRAATSSLSDIGDEAREAASDLQRLGNSADELNGLRSDFSRVETAANEAGNEIDQAGDQAQDSAGDFDILGDSLDGVKTMFLGMAAAFGAKEIFSAADDLTKSMNQYQAATGASAAEMEKYGAAAKRIFTSGSGESMDDISKSMSIVKQTTGASIAEVEKMTTSALTLRDTFDMDVNESIRSVNMIMKQFGVDSNTAFGMIAQGAQLGLNQNQNLLDSFNEYSVHFKKLGFDASGMMTLFGKVSQEGVFDVDKIGDAVKEFSIRAIDGSKLSTEAFTALGLSAQEISSEFAAGGDSANQAFLKVVKGLKGMEDPIKQDAAGVALFGTMWEDIGKKAVFAMADTENALGNAGEAMDNLNEVKYNDATTALTALGRTINVELGELATGAVKELQATFVEMKESGAIEEFFDGMQSSVDAVVKAFVTLKPIVGSILSFMSSNWGVVAPVIASVASAMVSLNVAMGIYNTYTKIATLVEAARAAVTWVSNSAIWAMTKALWASAAAMLANPWTWVVLGIMAIIAAIVLCVVYWDEISAAITSWANVVLEWLGVAWEFWSSMFASMWASISGFMLSCWNVIVTVWMAIWGFIGPLLTALWNLYVSIWSLIFTVIYAYCMLIWMGISIIWNSIWSTISAVCSAIWGVISAVWSSIWGFLQPIVQSIWNFLSTAWNAISSVVSSVSSSIMNVVLSTWNSISSSVISLATSMWTGVKNTFTEALNWITGIASDFFDAGGQIINGLVEGLTAGISKITGVVNNIKGAITGGLKKVMDINSPAKVMIPIGSSVVEGVEVGMEERSKNLYAVEDNLFGDMPDYTPESTVASATTGGYTQQEVAPVFNIAINGADNPENMRNQIVAYVQDGLSEAFRSLGRSNPRLREV